MTKTTWGLGGLLCVVVVVAIGGNGYAQHKANKRDPDIMYAQIMDPDTLKQIALRQQPPPNEELEAENKTAWRSLAGVEKMPPFDFPVRGMNHFVLSPKSKDEMQVYLITGEYDHKDLRCVAAFMAKPKCRLYKSCLSFEKPDGKIVRWSGLAVFDNASSITSEERGTFHWKGAPVKVESAAARQDGIKRDPDIIYAQALDADTLKEMAYLQQPPPDEELADEKKDAWQPLPGVETMPEIAKLTDGTFLSALLNDFHLPPKSKDRMQVYLLMGKDTTHNLRCVAAFMAKPKYREYKSCMCFEKLNGAIVRWSRGALLDKATAVGGPDRSDFHWKGLPDMRGKGGF